MKPALTAEEWNTGGRGVGVCSEVGATTDWLRIELSDCGESQPMTSTFEGQERHAIAALALYGQPFGFDFVDRDRLRAIATEIDKRGLPEAWSDRLRDVANRLAALLPPEEQPDQL